MTFDGQRNFQTEIETGKLYKVNKASPVSGVSEQLVPSLQVIGETVDVYGSQVEEAAPPTNMHLDEVGFSGLKPFNLIPNYIYLADNSGTPDNVIVSGLDVVEVV